MREKLTGLITASIGPFEWMWEAVGRIFEMEDSAVGCGLARGGGGGVEEERAHEEGIPGAGDAGSGRELRAALRDGSGIKQTRAMRAGKNAEGAIVYGAGIKVNSEREHAFENGARRLNVRDAGLEGPGAKAGKIMAMTHGDGGVLMPRDAPVGGGVFVEQETSHENGLALEEGMEEVMEQRRAGQFGDGGKVMGDMADGVGGGTALAGERGWKGGDRLEEVGDLIGEEEREDKGVTGGVELIG